MSISSSERYPIKIGSRRDTPHVVIYSLFPVSFVAIDTQSANTFEITPQGCENVKID